MPLGSTRIQSQANEDYRSRAIPKKVMKDAIVALGRI